MDEKTWRWVTLGLMSALLIALFILVISYGPSH